MRFAAKLFVLSFVASMFITHLDWHNLTRLSIFFFALAILAGLLSSAFERPHDLD